MITFLDDVAVCIPMLNAWDQFVWPPGTAMPHAAMEVEQYGYCRSQAIDLGPVMLAMQFRMTDEEGTYLCVARALVFEGSVLAYNPAKDEAEWVPRRGVANDLSWAEERSAMALANFMPRAPQEAARIARLGTHHLVSWLDDSSSEEEDDDDGQAEEEGGEPEEEDPVDLEEQGEANPEPSSGSVGLE